MALTEERKDEASDIPSEVPSEPRVRKTPWIIAAFAVIAGAAAIWFSFQNDTSDEATEPTGQTLEFEEVVRTDLHELTEYEGTIGRLESDAITIRTAGTVTATPEEGSELEQGEALIWVDNQPITLIYGELPAWRTMAEDTEGPDVLQLETALVEFGVDGVEEMSVDGVFTSYTETLVTRWQQAIGASDDGVVDLGEVVFSPDPLRVDSLQVEVGALVNAGTVIFTTTSNEVEVRFDLPTTEEDSLAVGDSVEITMPDLTTTTGTVTEIATVATQPEGGGQATFEVTVTLDAPNIADGIDEAPVTVEVVTDSVEDVVAVPVEALLALAEGGYAVEVQDATGTHLAAVEPGFYADGLVEVAGDLAAGDMVVVP